MNSDVTLAATETRHSGMAYTLQGALLAYFVLVEQVLLHIMHNEKIDRRVASLSFTGSDGVADQLECQVLEVVLVVRELLENFFRVAFSGKNETVVGAGHQEVVEDSTPPFLRSVLEHVVADHLVKKIDSLHVLLVVGETLWRVDVLSIALCSAALHLTNVGRIVEV